MGSIINKSKSPEEIKDQIKGIFAQKFDINQQSKCNQKTKQLISILKQKENRIYFFEVVTTIKEQTQSIYQENQSLSKENKLIEQYSLKNIDKLNIQIRSNLERIIVQKDLQKKLSSYKNLYSSIVQIVDEQNQKNKIAAISGLKNNNFFDAFAYIEQSIDDLHSVINQLIKDKQQKFNNFQKQIQKLAYSNRTFEKQKRHIASQMQKLLLNSNKQINDTNFDQQIQQLKKQRNRFQQQSNKHLQEIKNLTQQIQQQKQKSSKNLHKKQQLQSKINQIQLYFKWVITRTQTKEHFSQLQTKLQKQTNKIYTSNHYQFRDIQIEQDLKNQNWVNVFIWLEEHIKFYVKFINYFGDKNFGQQIQQLKKQKNRFQQQSNKHLQKIQQLQSKINQIQLYFKWVITRTQIKEYFNQLQTKSQKQTNKIYTSNHYQFRDIQIEQDLKNQNWVNVFIWLEEHIKFYVKFIDYSLGKIHKNAQDDINMPIQINNNYLWGV